MFVTSVFPELVRLANENTVFGWELVITMGFMIMAIIFAEKLKR
jgi:hypothetical protein